jgi:hypothetical protein
MVQCSETWRNKSWFHIFFVLERPHICKGSTVIIVIIPFIYMKLLLLFPYHVCCAQLFHMVHKLRAKSITIISLHTINNLPTVVVRIGQKLNNISLPWVSVMKIDCSMHFWVSSLRTLSMWKSLKVSSNGEMS